MKTTQPREGFILSPRNRFTTLLQQPTPAKKKKPTLAEVSEPVLFFEYNGGYSEEMLDTFQWGTQLPGDFLRNPYMHIELRVETDDLPETTQISTLWQAVDGSGVYRTEPAAINTPDVLHIAFNDKDLLKFEGKTVNVTYTLHSDDGSEVSSPVRVINVTTPVVLEMGKPVHVIEGVINGILNPSSYPNGLNVDIGPIDNGQPYQALRCEWAILLPRDDITFTLYELTQELPYEPDASFQFHIPAEGYTGYPQDAIGSCWCWYRYLPYPSLFEWSFGATTFRFTNNP